MDNNTAIATQSNTAFVSRITRALEQHDQVYPQLIEQAGSFDKTLAAKIAKAAQADMELLQYIKSRSEQAGDKPGMFATIVALLLGR